MAFSIEEFKSNGLVFGGARPSLFQVIVPEFPIATAGGTNNVQVVDLSRSISFLAKAASIPPSIIDYIDIPYMSRKIRVSGDRSFPDWSMTVMNDENFSIRAAIEGWHEAINSRQKNVQAFPEVKTYKTNIVVHQYSKTGTDSINGTVTVGTTSATAPIKSYTLIGAFPTSVAPIGLDWDYVNQIEQFDVTFAYDYWEPFEDPGSLTSPEPTNNR